MKNQQQQQQHRAVEVTEQVHGKESTELTADGSSGIDGSLIITATTPTVTTTTSTLSTIDQQAYEEQFIKEPTGGETTTTYSLFSSGDAFSEEAIRSKTHYIKNEISGQLWLDEDRNGKRGSFTDSTLNAIEQDSGVTGVDAIVLVDCDTNTEVAVTKSQPVRGDGEVVIQKVTETGGVAGGYRFPEVMNRPGRYYIVYKAPMNYRVNTNVLPTTEVKAERNGDGTLSYFECPMVGGEGGMFYDEAVTSGEFDYGGYCGRSVGCFEVGKKKDLEKKFENLVEVEEESEYGPDDMVVVYPSEHMLDVGLSQQAWPLATQQYADIEIDLLFPQNSTEAVYTTLGETLESESALAESATVAEIQRTLLDSVMSIQGFSGVQLEVDGVTMSMVAEHEKNSEEKSEIFSRHLRSSSRKLQESVEEPSSTTAVAAASVSGYTVVTYKFTARGEYNPPPRLQLGEIAEQSINADSRRLTKTLREKIGDAFVDLETVNSKHLTVKGYGDTVAADNSATESRTPPLETLNAQNAEARTGGLAPWATVPIILLAVLISGLVGLFFFRRAFSRRKVVNDPKDLEKGEKKKEEKYDYADEEAAAKGHGDNMDTLMVDKAEDVPANMTGSGTDGSSGNSAEERNAVSSERRRRKPKSSRSRAREIASSLKRSLTLEKEESVLSDLSDTEEKRRKRKKAKEEARRLSTEDDAEGTSERRRSSRRRSTGSTLRSSLRAAGEAVERRRKRRSTDSSRSKPRHSSRKVVDEEV
mmetsp:Transcript_21212/g.42645  ORF Transcript_21212/g.42645 Transcript_21212/m.42645 type:complete len:756 (-) Transcript_21212:36-2303(-)